MECKRVIQAKEEDSEALKTEQLRLHKELDILRAQIIENDSQHEEEVVRLRTELRMARRHEEFLSKELEAQRSTSSRRLNELQAQSNSEMLSMRAEINSLSLRCEELSTGHSIIAMSDTPLIHGRKGRSPKSTNGGLIAAGDAYDSSDDGGG